MVIVIGNVAKGEHTAHTTGALFPDSMNVQLWLEWV